MKRLLTTKDVTEYPSMSPRTVRDRMQDGTMPSQKIGGLRPMDLGACPGSPDSPRVMTVPLLRRRCTRQSAQ